MTARDRSVGSRTAKDAYLIAALLNGATIEAAAAAAFMSDRTARRRLADPDFRADLDEARRDLMQRSCALLANSAVVAVRTLVDICRDEAAPPAARVGAARAILSAAVDYTEHSVVEQRLESLERMVAQRGPLGIVR